MSLEIAIEVQLTLSSYKDYYIDFGLCFWNQHFGILSTIAFRVNLVGGVQLGGPSESYLQLHLYYTT